MEGAFFGYTGKDVDWFVRSWLGNRKASIIDMNINVALGQETQVPNLMIIFGTVPNLLFYADYVPRVDLKVNEDYVNRYYSGDVNKDYLEFRKNTDFVWSASHGPIIRGMQSPVCSSYITALTDEHIDQCEAYLEPVRGPLVQASTTRRRAWPPEKRDAQQNYDFTYRDYTNRSDPDERARRARLRQGTGAVHARPARRQGADGRPTAGSGGSAERRSALAGARHREVHDAASRERREAPELRAARPGSAASPTASSPAAGTAQPPGAR